MREHMGLYRGKRKGKGEWVEGGLYDHKDPNGSVWFIVRTDLDGSEKALATEFILVDPDTVGECTGLTDKHNKLIFEGDILHQRGLNWLVGFQRGAFAALNEKKEMQFAFFEQYDFYKGEYHFPDSFEIIGNVHDNPELMEGAGEDAAD